MILDTHASTWFFFSLIRVMGGLLAEESEKRFLKTFEIGFLIGYTVSSVTVIAIFMFYFMGHGHFKKRKKTTMKTPMMESLIERRERKRIEAIQEISKLEKMITRFSLRALYNATNNFSQKNIIGVGKMGTMYKGKLPCGSLIAVKRLQGFQHLENGFISKLMVLGRLRHNNIVPLFGFGFCIESRETLLVYKYMSNGNLYNWLHPKEDIDSQLMKWPVRVFIAIKVAKGLIHLHNNCKFVIVHLNISSNSILLDKNFEPKISNLGGAMLLSKSVEDFLVNGGIGKELDVSKKDVYRFGILLLELITGEDLINNSKYFHSLKENLVEEIIIHHSTRCLFDAVDKSIISKGFDTEILHFLRVACECLQPLPDKRPTMIQVYKKLMAFKKISNLTQGFEEMLDIKPIGAASDYDNIELEIVQDRGIVK